jgi:hypothetical protein
MPWSVISFPHGQLDAPLMRRGFRQWGQYGLAEQGGASPNDGYAVYPNTTAFKVLQCVIPTPARVSPT